MQTLYKILVYMSVKKRQVSSSMLRQVEYFAKAK
jgi:hypothetical protein